MSSSCSSYHFLLAVRRRTTSLADLWPAWDDAKARGGILGVTEEIYDAYRRAWILTYRKIEGYPLEVEAWHTHRMFCIGGGSLVSKLVSALRVHPGTKDSIELMPIEVPADLYNMNMSRPSAELVRFSAVAYGLSTIGLSIPEVQTPNQVPPLPDLRRVRERLDREDIYAK